VRDRSEEVDLVAAAAASLAGMDGPVIGRLARYVAISGNVVFVAWVLFNAVDSGFSGSRVEVASSLALLALLGLNTTLLLRSRPVARGNGG
jgi:hypothetical protein